jgi:hypothetical protein
MFKFETRISFDEGRWPAQRFERFAFAGDAQTSFDLFWFGNQRAGCARGIGLDQGAKLADGTIGMTVPLV